MAVTAVFGVHWGDEGKGKVIDAMLEKERYDIVARWNGGDNAGHSIETDKLRVGLHLVPSGIFHEDVLNVMGNGELINLASLKEEIEKLLALNVKVTPENLVLSSRSHLILPYYRDIEKRKELSRHIGTTGRGIGIAYTFKPDRTGVRVTDIMDSGNSFRKNVRMHADEFGLDIDVEGVLAEQRKLLESLRKYLRVEDTVYLFARRSGANILLEGAQGTLLDVDVGTYPFVTSSNSSPAGAYAGCAGIPRIDRIVGVMKGPYITRVGGGTFPTGLITEEENAQLEEELKERKARGLELETLSEDDVINAMNGDRLCLAKYLRVKGMEYGTTTGRARRPGEQDLVAARFALYTAGRPESLGSVEIVLTKNDIADGLGEIRICTGYEIDGSVKKEFPSSVEVLSRAHPIYETVEGWRKSTRGVTNCRDLPRQYTNFVGFIGKELEVGINMISTGPRRDEVVYMNDRDGW